MATRRVCIFFAASSEQRVVTLNVKCGLEGSGRPCTHGVTFKNSVSVSAGTVCCSCSQAVAPSMSEEASVDQVESNCPVAHCMECVGERAGMHTLSQSIKISYP